MGISRDVTARELAGLPGGGLPHTVPIGEPFQQLFGIGATTQRQLDAAGEIETVLVTVPGRDRAGTKSGRGRRVIIVASYLAYLDRQRQREAAGEIGTPSPNPRARQRHAAVASPAPPIATSTARPRRSRSVR